MPDTLIEIDHDDGAEDGTDPGESVEVSGQADPAPGAPGGDPVITGTTGTMQAAVTVATIDMPTVKKRRLNPGSGDTILLHFTNDCWVRVKDSTGRMLFSDMGRAGGGLELIGTGPFDVLLGFAPGATLNWNGSEVALAPHMRNNVATILLDRDASGSGSDG